MRLINTQEPLQGPFQIKEFREDEIPKYAILSHVWGGGEVTLKDMESFHVPEQNGYEKIRRCCSVARNAGFEYVWVDTCCIDKTSSAELSEAINSMFRWYQEAEICYAYLADVPANQGGARFPPDCKWFTRGWTLQELIAPSEVIFINQEWEQFGAKSDPGLQLEISNITNIPVGILSGDDEIETASIAQRMSWASNRKTSRLEDWAYCLLGIFDIQMPLIYGEGSKAFIRLQEEIIKVSDDDSIFAWRCTGQSHGGLLATSPASFERSSRIVLRQGHSTSDSPWTISNRGIHIELPFLGIGQQGLGLAILQCTERGGNDASVGIYLRDTSLTMSSFERVFCEEFTLIDLTHFRPSQYPSRRICVRQRRLGPKRLSRATDKGHIEAGQLILPQIDNKANLEDTHGRTILSHAAESGDEEQVWLLLTQSDVEIHQRDNRGQTPLSYAAMKGHKMIIDMILARGNVPNNFKDNTGRTPLSHAAEGGHTAAVKVFLARSDMEPKMRDNDGLTSFEYAVMAGHKEVVRLLLDRGVDINMQGKLDRTPLEYATQRADTESMEVLLNHGADINAKGRLGKSPINYAVGGGYMEAVRLLLDRGANINTRDEQDRTPLDYAAEKGIAKVVELLLDRGACIEARSPFTESPINYAVRGGHIQSIELLLDRGSNVDSRNAKDETLLTYATKEGKKDIMRLLLNRDADINAKDRSGWTPLMLGVASDDEHILKLLVSKVANVNEKVPGSDRTLLSFAAGRGKETSVKCLCAMGADVNAKDDFGWTPLVYAIVEKHQGIVSFLLDNGADIELKSNTGMTALAYAMRDGGAAITSLLVKHQKLVQDHNNFQSETHQSDVSDGPKEGGRLAKLQRRFLSHK